MNRGCARISISMVETMRTYGKGGKAEYWPRLGRPVWRGVSCFVSSKSSLTTKVKISWVFCMKEFRCMYQNLLRICLQIEPGIFSHPPGRYQCNYEMTYFFFQYNDTQILGFIGIAWKGNTLNEIWMKWNSIPSILLKKCSKLPEKWLKTYLNTQHR